MAVLYPVILLDLLHFGVVVGLIALIDRSRRKANDRISLLRLSL